MPTRPDRRQLSIFLDLSEPEESIAFRLKHDLYADNKISHLNLVVSLPVIHEPLRVLNLVCLLYKSRRWLHAYNADTPLDPNLRPPAQSKVRIDTVFGPLCRDYVQRLGYDLTSMEEGNRVVLTCPHLVRVHEMKADEFKDLAYVYSRRLVNLIGWCLSNRALTVKLLSRSNLKRATFDRLSLRRDYAALDIHNGPIDAEDAD